MNQQFSIIVASYNNSAYLPQCLDSLINQSYQNIQIVVIDDASSDNSASIVRDFQNRDIRVELFVNAKNMGVGYTKCRGFEHSSGSLLGTIGADDTLTTNAIELMVEKHENHPEASLVYSTHYICNSELEIIRVNDKVCSIPLGEKYLTYKGSTSSAIASFRTFKRDFYLKTGGFNPSYRKAVDKDIIYKLEEVGETIFIDKPLYYYRHHNRSISLFRNETKAIWWEIKAKKDAFKRRKSKADIKNITQRELKELLDYYYRRKIEDCRNNRKYFLLLIAACQLFANKPSRSSILHIYYTFKKILFPNSFSGEAKD